MLGVILRRTAQTVNETTMGFFVGRAEKLQSAIPYQSPQCDDVICWNFIFHESPCFTQTVVKC